MPWTSPCFSILVLIVLKYLSAFYPTDDNVVHNIGGIEAG